MADDKKDVVQKKKDDKRATEQAEAEAFQEQHDEVYERLASTGERRPGSIIGDEIDVVKKAALTTPANTRFNEETGEFEGGEAPGEGTVAFDPKVVEATEREKEDG